MKPKHSFPRWSRKAENLYQSDRTTRELATERSELPSDSSPALEAAYGWAIWKRLEDGRTVPVSGFTGRGRR